MTCPPHHWDIAECHGETSRGVCWNCGETREFHNWWEGGLRFGRGTPTRKGPRPTGRAGGRRRRSTSRPLGGEKTT